MLALLASLLLLAVVAVQSHPVAISRGAVAPEGWVRTNEAVSSERVHFFLALPQRNLAELDRLFWAVSDPDSAQYGEFMTTEEIQALVSPPWAERQELIQWLVEQGVEREGVLDYGDSVEVDASVAVARRLFDATFHVFENGKTGRRLVRPSSAVSIPAELAGRIETVMELVSFPAERFGVHAAQAPGQVIVENDAIIPQSLWAMYGLPRNTTVDNSHRSNVSQGVIEWEGQNFRPIDLVWFAGNTSLHGVPVIPPEQVVGNNNSIGGGESTLDVDMMVGAAPGNSNWFWLEDNRTTWLYGFSVHFLNASTVPDVISVSYGWYEGDQCSNGIGGGECRLYNETTVPYVQRTNTQWQKIALRGVSTMVSSGDSGSHTRSDRGCTAPTLLADYPASCPYITSVGATMVNNATFFPSTIAPACRERSGPGRNFTCVSGGVEVAVDYQRAHFTSGGGFSNISAGQSYQAAAVAGYLAQKVVPLPPAQMFNAKGRAYPDVSAVGHNAYVLDNGREGLSGGTSQSSPIFAAVMALVNVRYKKITNSPLGFLNVLLYKMWADNPAAFTDVVSGDNICTEGGCASSCTGYRAAPGWDPVTGLGTPNFPTMVAYIEDLANKVVARRAAKAQPRVAEGVYGTA